VKKFHTPPIPTQIPLPALRDREVFFQGKPNFSIRNLEKFFSSVFAIHSLPKFHLHITEKIILFSYNLENP